MELQWLSEKELKDFSCNFQIPEKENESVVEQVKMDDSMSDWEDMSVDMVQWNVLLKQLEDLSSLSRLIRYQPTQLRRLNASQLDYYIDQISEDPLDFTLSGILQKGRGNLRYLKLNLRFHFLFPLVYFCIFLRSLNNRPSSALFVDAHNAISIWICQDL